MLIVYIIFTLIIISLWVLPVFPCKHWFFRIFDFIRVYMTFIYAILILIWSYFFPESFIVTMLWIILFIHILYNLKIFYPYFSYKKPLVFKWWSDTISIISSNVLKDNTQYEKIIQIVWKYNPDIFIALETDDVWKKKLQEWLSGYLLLEDDTKDNFYGMCYFSKLPKKNSSLHYLQSKSYPSVEVCHILESKREFTFFWIHPPPPSPTEVPTSKEKDTELFRLAKKIQEATVPCIVMWDFNSVSWSKWSKTFLSTSWLIDGRVGRWFLPTFPAKLWRFGIPIDLVYHSNTIQIKQLKTLWNIWSDHLPVYCEIEL